MLRVLELFGGIGACSKALERLGVDFEIADYVEIDKYAVKSFNAMHDTHFSPQDISQWDKDIQVDLIMHGSPCQDFSLAGKNKGGDEGSGTRSSLMYETLRIVEKLKPKYVIWENVRNLLSAKHKHNFDKYIARIQELDYTSYYQVLDTQNYGIPQHRERVFTISIRNDLKQGFIFPQKQELKLKLKDMLESDVDAKYFLSPMAIERLIRHENNIINKDNPDVSSTICASYYKMQSGYQQYIKIKNATKKGYSEAKLGDSVNLAFPDSKTRRGRVGKGVAQTLDTACEQGVVAYDEQNQYMRTDGTVGTITTDGSSPKHNNMAVEIKDHKLTIRRLTPKECWRLQGFDDSDFDKAALYNSDTQLYKQAGNSITVNVLEVLLTGLIINQTPRDQIPEQLTLFDMFQIET